jgi:hypothetical protein
MSSRKRLVNGASGVSRRHAASAADLPPPMSAAARRTIVLCSEVPPRSD